jgi:hypothetical protein
MHLVAMVVNGSMTHYLPSAVFKWSVKSLLVTQSPLSSLNHTDEHQNCSYWYEFPPSRLNGLTNESTDNEGFTPVLGRGHRVRDPERMKALALSTADSDDEAAPAHPRRQPSQRTKAKSSCLNTVNSFESLDVEDISDPDDTNYQTDEELPNLLSGSDSESDSAQETDGSDIEEITNAEVSISFLNVARN